MNVEQSPTVQHMVADITAQGYRRISNKYGTVARVDREDWVQVMAKHLRRAPADFYVLGEDKVTWNWCDYYLRTLSKDKLTLPPSVAAMIPSSIGDNVGYVAPKSQGIGEGAAAAGDAGGDAGLTG